MERSITNYIRTVTIYDSSNRIFLLFDSRFARYALRKSKDTRGMEKAQEIIS